MCHFGTVEGKIKIKIPKKKTKPWTYSFNPDGQPNFSFQNHDTCSVGVYNENDFSAYSVEVGFKLRHHGLTLVSYHYNDHPLDQCVFWAKRNPPADGEEEGEYFDELVAELDEMVSSYKVYGPCICDFYTDESCQPDAKLVEAYYMLANNLGGSDRMHNRTDNDAFRSIKCRRAPILEETFELAKKVPCKVTLTDAPYALGDPDGPGKKTFEPLKLPWKEGFGRAICVTEDQLNEGDLELAGKVSGYKVEGECSCDFFSTKDCYHKGLFSASNREHDALFPDSQDRIRSFKCWAHDDFSVRQ